MESEMDAYQQAVEYLTANPGEIYEAWEGHRRAIGGCLFMAASQSGSITGTGCGCLMMIRSSIICSRAATPELTVAIQNDRRIPGNPREMTVDDLPVFAGWQRRIDQILGRTPPAMDPRIPLPTGDIEIPLASAD
jgi:hypothetical protein